ncbi:MAG TPA: metal-dependent hydrolase [Gammaproteobacteria bacterium]|nr:metal-dependent hydrolase [Gammaproteobacteria bacterium]
MDPIAHTFAGMALAAAGLRRATPLATSALLIGANAPDVDVFSGAFGSYSPIAFRRGWTHGLLAVAVWPFLLAGALLVYDRYVRRRRDPAAPPPRAGPLLAVTALGVATHPALDWLNNYGLRWLMPFDGRWFYGDAVFIIDPWLWLLLGGAALLTYSHSRLAHVRWTAFFALASVLIFVCTALGLVPATSALAWIVGVAAVVAARWWLRAAPPATLERAAQVGVALASVYVVTLAGASAAARDEVRATVAARGIEAEDVSLAPQPADPLRGEVVIMTRDDYYTGSFDWLVTPHLALDAGRVARPRGPLFEAASQARDARLYLTWTRFPAIEIEQSASGGTLVRFFDMRYRSMDRIVGPTVQLDASGALRGD